MTVTERRVPNQPDKDQPMTTFPLWTIHPDHHNAWQQLLKTLSDLFNEAAEADTPIVTVLGDDHNYTDGTELLAQMAQRYAQLADSCPRCDHILYPYGQDTDHTFRYWCTCGHRFTSTWGTMLANSLPDTVSTAYANALWLTPTRSGDRARLRDAILERDNYTCCYCMTRGELAYGPDGRRWHIDHVIPRSKGGADTADNLVTSCATCNNVKSADTWTPAIDNRDVELP